MRPLFTIALLFLFSLAVHGKGYFGAYTLQGRMYDRSTDAVLKNELFFFNGDSIYTDSTGGGREGFSIVIFKRHEIELSPA